MARQALRTTPNLEEQSPRGTGFERHRSIVVLGDDARSLRRGFTIVELLIVIVVIAILAAITVVAYTGIQNRAKASAAQAAVRQAADKIQLYATANADQYPADLFAAGVATGSAAYEYRVDNNAIPKTFCLTATTQNVSYYMSNTAMTPTAGGCPGHSADGVAAITNYAANPTYDGTAAPSAVGQATGVGIGTCGGQPAAIATANSTNNSVVMVGPWARRWAIGEGQSVYAQATIYNQADTPRNFSLQVRFYDATGSSSGNQVGSNVNSSSTSVSGGQTGLIQIQATAPAGTQSVQLMVMRGTNGAVAGDQFCFDNVFLSDREAGYADGNTPGWIWNGSPNDSTSTGPMR